MHAAYVYLSYIAAALRDFGRGQKSGHDAQVALEGKPSGALARVGPEARKRGEGMAPGDLLVKSGGAVAPLQRSDLKGGGASRHGYLFRR